MSPATGISLGVVFRPQSPPEDLRAVVDHTEDAGVEQLWLWEDCFLEGGLTTAAAALAWSDRLQVGVGLLPVPLRNPALAAMEIATLARLFPGRLAVTLGHGVQDWMDQVGARVESPLTLLREHTSAARALVGDAEVAVYAEVDPRELSGLPARLDDLAQAGAGTVILQAPGEAPDPRPLIDALGSLP